MQSAATSTTTALERAEEALDRAQRRAELIMAALPSLMVAVDHNGVVVEWNLRARDVLGPSISDAIGYPLHELRLTWDIDLQKRVSEALESAEPLRIDNVHYTNRVGQDGLLGITIVPVEDPDRTGDIAYLLLGADITERKGLETQLAHAQRMESIGNLAAGIAHEINTPVQYVGDNVRFLKDAVSDLEGIFDLLLGPVADRPEGETPESVLKQLADTATEVDIEYLREEIPAALEQSLEGLNRVANIVGAMKHFAHPGALEKAPVDLKKAISDTLTVTRNEWKYVATVETKLDDELPLVPCLAGELNQVLLNLLVNASHAIGDVKAVNSDHVGKIAVTTKRSGDWAEISIGDNGGGIPEQHRSKIFDPFFTTKDIGKGTGQGLAIAYSVVKEKHGGEIVFETQEGSGTTFTIRLPIQGCAAGADDDSQGL